MGSQRMTFFACEAAERRLSRVSQPNGWRKYRIAPELETVGLEMICLFPSQVVWAKTGLKIGWKTLHSLKTMRMLLASSVKKSSLMLGRTLTTFDTASTVGQV